MIQSSSNQVIIMEKEKLTLHISLPICSLLKHSENDHKTSVKPIPILNFVIPRLDDRLAAISCKSHNLKICLRDREEKSSVEPLQTDK